MGGVSHIPSHAPEAVRGSCQSCIPPRCLLRLCAGGERIRKSSANAVEVAMKCALSTSSAAYSCFMGSYSRRRSSSMCDQVAHVVPPRRDRRHEETIAAPQAAPGGHCDALLRDRRGGERRPGRVSRAGRPHRPTQPGGGTLKRRVFLDRQVLLGDAHRELSEPVALVAVDLPGCLEVVLHALVPVYPQLHG